MAAMMSRALDFSPLAMAGDECSEIGFGGLGELTPLVGGGVTGGCSGSGSAAVGFMGRESNSVG
jgi:hypothetical protein